MTIVPGGYMSSRVTIRDVRGAFTRAEVAARAVGLDTNSWYLIPGSAANGRAWRLFTRPGAGDAITGLDRGFLGMTAREAYHALIMMAIAWEAVQDAWQRDCTCPADFNPIFSRHERSCARYTVTNAMLGNLGELNSG